jgi:hypothetical protein
MKSKPPQGYQPFRKVFHNGPGLVLGCGGLPAGGVLVAAVPGESTVETLCVEQRIDLGTLSIEVVQKLIKGDRVHAGVLGHGLRLVAFFVPRVLVVKSISRGDELAGNARNRFKSAVDSLAT